MGTIVLYPSPGMGHLVSMVELGKLITTHHPNLSVTILITTTLDDTLSASTAPYVDRVSAAFPTIIFHHLPGGDRSVSAMPSQNLIVDISFRNPNLHQFLLTLSQKSNIKAFILDFFRNSAFEISTQLKIPTYYFFTSGGCGLSVFLYLPILHQERNKRKESPDSIFCVPGVPPITLRDFPSLLIDRNTKIYMDLLNIATNMAKSNGILINTFESLESRAVKAISDGQCLLNEPTPPIFCVGPLISRSYNQNDGDEHECLRWLDSQPSQSVVFLSFGSMGRFSSEQLKEMAVGLENSGHRFLWVVRSPPTEDKTKSTSAESELKLEVLLPNGFLDRTNGRGLVVKSWAPQVAVLSHDAVGGFVTHCGWNSILESVSAGKPMIAWPLYAEQRMNRVFLVEEFKLALAVNESDDGFVTATELEDRVRQLMDSERGQEVRESVLTQRDEAVAAIREGGLSRLALDKLAELWKNDEPSRREGQGKQL